MRKRPIYFIFSVIVASILLYIFVFHESFVPKPEPIAIKKKTILQWTPVFGEYKTESLNACPIKNKCDYFIDKSVLNQADAVVFHDIVGDFPKKTSDEQKFVIFTMESAINVVSEWSKVPENYIDWIMSHVSSSDVHSPYGGYWVNPKIAKERGFPSVSLPADETTIFSTKKIKGALWVVSNCKTLSKRELVFDELGKYFKIDIAGKCGKNKTMKNYCSREGNCIEKKSSYYFLIIPENTICRDYITEKYWWAYELPIIPIVMKREIYEMKVPPKSFIAVNDFQNSKEMANYLNNLMENRTAYMEYFKWRKDGWAVAPWNTENYRIGMCDLCEKLWKNEKKKDPYLNVSEWFLEANSCEHDEFANEWIRKSKLKQ